MSSRAEHFDGEHQPTERIQDLLERGAYLKKLGGPPTSDALKKRIDEATGREVRELNEQIEL